MEPVLLTLPPTPVLLVPASMFKPGAAVRLAASPSMLRLALAQVTAAQKREFHLNGKLRAMAMELRRSSVAMSDDEVAKAIGMAIANGRIIPIRVELDSAPIAKPTVPSPPPDVAAPTDVVERFKVVMRLVPSNLEPAAREQFRALVSDEALATMAVLLAIWAAGHFFGYGEAIDGGLILVGWYYVGSAILTAAELLADGMSEAYSAAKESELKHAAKEIADAIAIVGVTTFLILLGKIASRIKGRGGGSKPPPDPPPPDPEPPGPKPPEPPKPPKPPPDPPPSPGPQEVRPTRFPRTPEQYEDLAKDPAHNGKISDKSRQERNVAVSVENRGDVPGPVTRSADPKADFVDGSGQKWDVKGFNSNYPKAKGGFDLSRDAGKVDAELAKGQNVMLDTTNMSEADAAALRTEAARRGWGPRVLWFP